MQAAMAATHAGIMEPVFTGERNDIEREAEKLGWDIRPFRLIEAEGEAASGFAAAQACGAGEADVLMKGQLHTDAFLKSALNREAGLRTGERLVHTFHISHADGGRPMLISDAAVNVAPDMVTRQASTHAVVDMLRALGNDHPRVAFLSATENPIPSVPSAVEARALAEWAKGNFQDASFSGPLALDLILSPDSVEAKDMDHDPVAGHADAIIVPEIVSGNAVFKALVYLSGGCAGGLVTGAKVPILLTSRSDPASARLASAALAAVMAQARDPI
jgi:phosphate acetyltransferase